MQNKIYPYVLLRENKYTFISIGKRRITKQVLFTPTGIDNIVNLGFGDLMPDGSIDDTANSNNGDIVSVLATVVEILMDFTASYPHVEIFFAGSTPERTRLYTRILKTYFENFRNQFRIQGLIIDGERYVQVPFEPKIDLVFVGFIIRRNY